MADRVLEVSFRVTTRLKDLLSAELFEQGAGAVEERDAPDGVDLVVYCTSPREADRLESAARATARRAGLGAPAIGRKELDSSWATEWTRWLEPEWVTARVLLVPLGREAAVPRGKHRLVFDPKLVFGVGSHPTTRLAARAVERACQRERRLSVLDVGTGTGVLAMIAALSGAERVLGLDVDAGAVASARANARRNALGTRCRFSKRKLSSVRERFDLVVANIEVWVLEELVEELARVTTPRGRLLVTGLLDERAPALVARFEALGLRATQQSREQGWTLLELRRPPRDTAPPLRKGAAATRGRRSAKGAATTRDPSRQREPLKRSRARA